MSQLSNKEKKQLEDAVEQIIDLCSDGSSPDDAVIQTAKAMRLTPDRIPVLVNIYNIAATADRWNQSGSVQEKTASFPVANLHAIRQRLYPQSVKSAAVKKVPQTRFTNAFGTDPLACYRPNFLPVMQKSAAVTRTEKIGEKHNALLSQVNRMEKKSSSDAGMARVKLELCLNDLAKVMASASTPVFEDFCKTASVVFGDASLPILNSTAVMHPEVKKRKFTKSAALKANHPFFKLVKQAAGLLKEYRRLEKIQEHTLKKCASVRNQVTEQWTQQLYGSGMERLFNHPGSNLKKKGMSKTALNEDLDVVRPFTRLEALNYPEWQGTTEREYGILHTLNDPEHLAKLRRISNEALFADLINTDEFLKTQDPEAVLEAYNDILEVAPNLQGKKMSIRQALREYMASESLDLSTIGQLARMDADEASKADRKKQMDAESAVRFVDQKQREEDSKTKNKQWEAEFNARREETKKDFEARRKEFKRTMDAKKKDRKQQAEKFKQEQKSKRLDRALQQDVQRNTLGAFAYEGSWNRKSQQEIENKRIASQKLLAEGVWETEKKNREMQANTARQQAKADTAQFTAFEGAQRFNNNENPDAYDYSRNYRDQRGTPGRDADFLTGNPATATPYLPIDGAK